MKLILRYKIIINNQFSIVINTNIKRHILKNNYKRIIYCCLVYAKVMLEVLSIFLNRFINYTCGENTPK